ncbi:MAG: agmatine deiminase family protein [Bacteroidales bacterium]|nr:agmatine deiminase family protein [Bacteroidales bacterium]
MQNPNSQSVVFPAEWQKQNFVQLTWPHTNTDWIEYLEQAHLCFYNIAKAVVEKQRLLVVCSEIDMVKRLLADLDQDKIRYVKIENNDTWARDHGGITIFKNGLPCVYNFTFNGWGLKFPANLDNQITAELFSENIITNAELISFADMVFEGGSIESNGKGVLLTTTDCLLSKNRNEHLSKQQIEKRLCELFGAHTVLWLNSGYLAGDDTDSHIDTLARFVADDTIMYVACDDERDEHYTALKEMENELLRFRTVDNCPYKLIKLPMTPAVFDEDGFRIPATYANFLFINGAVLLPIYNVNTDTEAIKIFKESLPQHEIIPIDCSVLIKQHGSLHCVTMQYPEGVALNK